MTIDFDGVEDLDVVAALLEAYAYRLRRLRTQGWWLAPSPGIVLNFVRRPRR